MFQINKTWYPISMKRGACQSSCNGLNCCCSLALFWQSWLREGVRRTLCLQSECFEFWSWTWVHFPQGQLMHIKHWKHTSFRKNTPWLERDLTWVTYFQWVLKAIIVVTWKHKSSLWNDHWVIFGTKLPLEDDPTC